MMTRILPVTTIFPALALFGIAIAPSLAQTVNCANPQTTREMNICASQKYEVADKQLNQVYKKLRSGLSGQQRQRLTNAQLAWIKFRDANCLYESGQYEGGTLASSISTSCLTRVTQQRTQELEKYLLDKIKT